MARVLILDPFAGASHRAVSEGWRCHSHHAFERLELPPRHWKWRMRHAAWTFARQATALEGPFDAVWTTDMLDLAAWRGLAPPTLAALPHVCYLHETQLLYPDDHRGERDSHFAFTNLLSAAAADATWWNSAWHRDEAITAWRAWLRRFPDHQPLDAVDRVEAGARVLHPGIDEALLALDRHRDPEAPLHLLWCARWEADKDPAAFVAALDALDEAGERFRVSVIGGHDDGRLGCFAACRERHAERLVHWGWLEDRAAYHRALAEADVVVSTARHEFFGIAVVEALAGGCFPLLPQRLAYPEVIAGFGADGRDDGLYAGDHAALVSRLRELIARHAEGELWQGAPDRGRAIADAYAWPSLAPHWDAALAALTGG